jgi:hypothetical protein
VPRPVVALAFAWTAAAAATLGAQGGQPPARDSTRRDSSVTPAPLRDSVKAPYALGEAASAPTLGRTWHWGRDEIFRGGAVSLAELITQIPGAAMIRTGLMLSAQAITWWGHPGAVRVYLDGIELDGINPRDGRVQDLGAIAIWNLEEVTAEPTPAELRIHLRSWRVARTSAETRVDVLTGDQQTNLYRGFYGRRFQSGLGLQVGFQQFSTSFDRAGGDGSALSMFARLGWTRNEWSIDVVTQSDTRDRSATLREGVTGEPGSLPALKGKASLSYLRAAFRSPDGTKPWVQVLASGNGFREDTPAQSLSPGFGTMPADTADTNAFRAQYVITAGLNRWGVRTSAAARYRQFDGHGYLTPSARASWALGRARAQAFIERDQQDSILRADVGASLTVLPRLTFFAHGSRRSPLNGANATTANFGSLETAIRLRGLSFLGGVVSRARTTAEAPIAFGDSIAATSVGATQGATVGVWGPIYKALSVDVRATMFRAADVYRPKSEIRARIGLETEWRSRFPRGDFTVRAWMLYEHAGGMLFPVGSQLVALNGASPLTSILEVRIKSATLTWQFRNMLGTKYESVPGYPMPAKINLYGIRWNFTN